MNAEKDEIVGHLGVKVAKYNKQHSFIETLIYSISTGVLSSFLGLSLSLLRLVLLYIGMVYLVVPIIAKTILNLRVKSYINNSVGFMADAREGIQSFYLYNYEYRISWDYQEKK